MATPRISAAEFATTLWRALANCPPASLLWASLGYRAGLIDGRQAILDDLAQASRHPRAHDALRGRPIPGHTPGERAVRDRIHEHRNTAHRAHQHRETETAGDRGRRPPTT